MNEEKHPPDEAVSALFNLHDRIHELTRQYVEQVMKSRGELDERVATLSSILDSIGDGLTVVDRHGNLILVNDTARRTAGMPDDKDWAQEIEAHYRIYEADGKTPFNRDETLNEVLVVRKEPVDRLCLVTSKHLPPGGLWIRFRSSPIFDEAGEVCGAVSIFHDVTDMKKASDRIYELYNNAPCGYQSLDSEGTIVDINQTELDWIGASRQEVIGKKKFDEFLTEKSCAKFHEGFPQLKATGEISGVILELVRDQKPPLTVLWSSRAVYSPDGEFAFTRGTLFDITERVSLEAQRNTLASLITHDLKNHLVAESIFFDVVLQDRLPDLKEEERRLTEAMQAANHQFLNMANDLLELYRMERTGASADLAEVDLPELLKQLVSVSEPLAKMKDVKVRLTSGEPDCRITANSLALHHAIYNLIDNAIQYSPAGGQVTVSLSKENSTAVIKVADQGPGLTAEQKNALFTAPWSLSWEGSERMSTGLGLFLTKQIVDNHHGKLAVTSSPGEGSTFAIELPIE